MSKSFLKLLLSQLFANLADHFSQGISHCKYLRHYKIRYCNLNGSHSNRIISFRGKPSSAIGD